MVKESGNNIGSIDQKNSKHVDTPLDEINNKKKRRQSENNNRLMNAVVNYSFQKKFDSLKSELDKENTSFSEEEKKDIILNEIKRLQKEFKERPFIDKELSPHDIELKDKAQELAVQKEKRLREETTDKEKNARNQRDLKDFMANPYKWMEMDLENKLRINEGLLAHIRAEGKKAPLEATIIFCQEKLSLLKETYNRNIPLKLTREFTPKEIKLDGGEIVNVDDSLQYINRVVGRKNSSYEIVDVVQRKNDTFLVLKTTTDEEVEINTLDLSNITERQNKSQEIINTRTLEQSEEYQNLLKIISNRKEVEALSARIKKIDEILAQVNV